MQILQDAMSILWYPVMQPSHSGNIDCPTMDVVLAGHDVFMLSAQYEFTGHWVHTSSFLYVPGAHTHRRPSTHELPDAQLHVLFASTRISTSCVQLHSVMSDEPMGEVELTGHAAWMPSMQ